MVWSPTPDTLPRDHLRFTRGRRPNWRHGRPSNSQPPTELGHIFGFGPSFIECSCGEKCDTRWKRASFHINFGLPASILILVWSPFSPRDIVRKRHAGSNCLPHAFIQCTPSRPGPHAGHEPVRPRVPRGLFPLRCLGTAMPACQTSRKSPTAITRPCTGRFGAQRAKLHLFFGAGGPPRPLFASPGSLRLGLRGYPLAPSCSLRGCARDRSRFFP
jgi:hypothetical protein